MINTLIVGFGIAGFNYAEQLRRQKKTFVVIAPKTHSASHLAAGIINPTVLKRFNPVWKSDEFINNALDHYQSIQDLIKTKVIYTIPILRVLDNTREQNEWVVASSKTPLEKYLNNLLVPRDKFQGISAPFNFGEVLKSARVDNKTLLSAYVKKIIPNQFIEGKIDYAQLKINTDGIEYKGIQAKKIVFCEGYQSVNNPFFNYLPLIGSKGEMLIIKCDRLQENVIFKGPIFLSPIGEKKFWVGATFNREDKTTSITEKGKKWLINKLDKFLNLPYQILDHKAQIRATVIDRRPLLGVHPRYSNLFILNGMGTRGVLMSPLLSHWLFEYIENQLKLPVEADIKRFENNYFRNL